MTDQTLPQSRRNEELVQQTVARVQHAFASMMYPSATIENAIRDAFAQVARIPSETKAKWRPVSEKPPCANQYIALIALPDCDEPRVAQRYYSMTGKWDSDYVTHWMPFPEAP